MKCEEERFDLVLYHILFGYFNDFIDDIEVVDVPITGNKFTRVVSMVVKLSKLDRFLVSEVIIHRFQSLQVAVLDIKWSDHYPILLHDYKVDYSPTFLNLTTLGFLWMGLMKWCMGVIKFVLLKISLNSLRIGSMIGMLVLRLFEKRIS
uniref:Uncharacterized protein n=1 Tax=Lactuca sativa TaxID=4236 RepID=A0A9R1VEE2_LACSA|nr:hypothetical protein LSAT_V11C500269910 [Lactuca sativa]